MSRSYSFKNLYKQYCFFRTLRQNESWIRIASMTRKIAQRRIITFNLLPIGRISIANFNIKHNICNCSYFSIDSANLRTALLVCYENVLSYGKLPMDDGSRARRYLTAYEIHCRKSGSFPTNPTGDYYEGKFLIYINNIYIYILIRVRGASVSFIVNRWKFRSRSFALYAQRNCYVTKIAFIFSLVANEIVQMM